MYIVLGLKKAFDFVGHNILLQKLFYYGKEERPHNSLLPTWTTGFNVLKYQTSIFFLTCNMWCPPMNCHRNFTISCMHSATMGRPLPKGIFFC